MKPAEHLNVQEIVGYLFGYCDLRKIRVIQSQCHTRRKYALKKKKHKKSKKEQLCTVSFKILGFQSMHKLNFSGLHVFGEF